VSRCRSTTAAFPLLWPAGKPRRPASARKAPRFNIKEHNGSYLESKEMTVTEALNRLQVELDRIGARYPLVSSNLEARLDGRPRSGQRDPEDPGIAVYFDLKGKQHCLPSDGYTTVAGNIAAVAAHIAATRAIERHGVADVAEMFSGFAALPAPKKWFDILGVSERSSVETIERAYRDKAKTAHPDSPGGSNDAMAELNRAREEGLRQMRKEPKP